ncbi:MAG TPA: hypothetical protein VF283_06600 [Bryobacteraceae bacterium]
MICSSLNRLPFIPPPSQNPNGFWTSFRGAGLRVFTLLHAARPVLLNFGEPGNFDITPWADRVQLVDAKYLGAWELPALGAVATPIGVLVRPDGYVAWVGDPAQPHVAEALTTWFGPAATV